MVRGLNSLLELREAKRKLRESGRQVAGFDALAGDPDLGVVWALGGSPLETSPDTIFIRPLDNLTDPPTIARNPSRKDWAVGDLVQCEWMSAGPGSNLPTVIHHERPREIPEALTEWTATLEYTHEIVTTPPDSDSYPISVSIDGDDGFPHGPFTALTIPPYGRNVANRIITRTIIVDVVTTYVDQSGTEGGNPLVAAMGAENMSNINPSPAGAKHRETFGALAVDTNWVMTYIYQHHGTASWVGAAVIELWQPDVHTEGDADYIIAAELGDAS